MLVSRESSAEVAALYAEPMFVVNTNPVDDQDDNNTMMIGLGTRVRIRPATYLVGEITPRVSGYKPGVDQVSFGIEVRAGGHTVPDQLLERLRHDAGAARPAAA